MKILTLEIDFDTDIDEYQLIGIKSNFEDYKVAFLINKELEIKLSKQENLQVYSSDEKSDFSYFIYKDYDNQVDWRLIKNSSETFHTVKQTLPSLFTNQEIDTKTYYLYELSQFDYLLHINKIDDFFCQDDIIKKINQMENISAFLVEKSSVKNVNNLIF